MSSSKAPLEKTASENVYDRLLDYIFSDQANPGEKLVERDLAYKFEVSRVPIREALTKMVAQGLLVGGERRQGVRVRRYTPDESQQLTEFRFALECCAINVAAEKAEPSDIKLLKSIYEKEESIDRIADWTAWADLDHQFHVAIARSSHNARIVASLEALLTECHFVFYLHPDRKLPKSEEGMLAMKQRIIDDHRQIVAAITARDGAFGIDLLRRHLFV